MLKPAISNVEVLEACAALLYQDCAPGLLLQFGTNACPQSLDQRCHLSLNQLVLFEISCSEFV